MKRKNLEQLPLDTITEHNIEGSAVNSVVFGQNSEIQTAARPSTEVNSKISLLKKESTESHGLVL